LVGVLVGEGVTGGWFLFSSWLLSLPLMLLLMLFL
jgi:hypothetical protein